MEIKYDLVIIGGGPAGCSAAVYAARKQLKTLLIAKEWGGQSVVSDDIQNWIGTPHISGAKLAQDLKTHVSEYAGEILTIKNSSNVSAVSGSMGDFLVTCEDNTVHSTSTVLVTTGSNRRKLEVVGADIYEHKGLTYCASCDGPMFSGMPVVVIGGGNAAFESAAQLLAYCPTVYLINRTEEFRADEITVQKLKQNPNFHIITSAIVDEVHGETFVNGLTYTDSISNIKTKLDVSAVFVEIGQIPATGFVSGVVDLDKIGKIVIDPWTQKTNVSGIWAAGDCTNILYHQNNIASGDAVKALEDIYVTLKTK